MTAIADHSASVVEWTDSAEGIALALRNHTDDYGARDALLIEVFRRCLDSDEYADRMNAEMRFLSVAQGARLVESDWLAGNFLAIMSVTAMTGTNPSPSDHVAVTLATVSNGYSNSLCGLMASLLAVGATPERLGALVGAVA